MRDTGPVELLLMYYELMDPSVDIMVKWQLMDPCVDIMVKWQHRGVTYRDPARGRVNHTTAYVGLYIDRSTMVTLQDTTHKFFMLCYVMPYIEHAEPLGSLGLNGAGDDPADDYIPTGGEDSERLLQQYP
ncbi:hypothetical protein F511_29897 [Dorcoceras hygrometricum]|uniref:Uncharacterized protein n=1 Tax=Dorcoceras hygrometricum TaxID=472368 RepID=A0A2Z7B7W4_9LAMI|nr:hypothetical protein F511_29897 [Dorcoceras hygrometricum]